MMATALSDVYSESPFDATETSNVSVWWQWLIRVFELYADGKGATKQPRQKALLLCTTGTNIQDIFFILEMVTGGPDDDDGYTCPRKHLTIFSTPSKRPLWTPCIQIFDTIIIRNYRKYITRLLIQAQTCEFGNRGAVDNKSVIKPLENVSLKHYGGLLLEQGRELKPFKLHEITKA